MKGSRPGRAPVDLARTLAGAVKAPFPTFIPPAKPTLLARPPVGDRWQVEFKLDGWRAQLHRQRDAVTVYNSNGGTMALASLGAAAREVPADSFVFDGELVMLGADGRPNFHAVKSAALRDDPNLQFYAFDLLHVGDKDLRGVALGDRRRLLAQLLAGQPGGRIFMSETMEGTSADLFKLAGEIGMEGIVAKLTASKYRSGPVKTWVKVKCTTRMTLPVIGFVPAKGGSLAALRLGRREGRALIYVGKVGSGFTVQSAQSVRERLEPLIRAKPPRLAAPLNKPGTIWVEPQLQAMVEFLEFTSDGIVRQASFKGLKE